VTLYTRSFALLAAGAFLLAACGGSDDAASNDVQGDDFALDDSTSTTTSGRNPADVDVCALLSESDANDVARARGLDGAQTAATTYKLTATKEVGTGIRPTSGCKFIIAADEGAQAIVSFQVASAEGFSIYSGGTTIEGLGDEAYANQGSVVVRVDDLMLSPGENSATSDFATDLMRKMAPKLK
jgi:hypothetical protein